MRVGEKITYYALKCHTGFEWRSRASNPFASSCRSFPAPPTTRSPVAALTPRPGHSVIVENNAGAGSAYFALNLVRLRAPATRQSKGLAAARPFFYLVSGRTGVAVQGILRIRAGEQRIPDGLRVAQNLRVTTMRHQNHPHSRQNFHFPILTHLITSPTAPG
jgi:hypothetical protein